ncbi:MAG: Uma2 family endonuclease [Myxococcales bacterium]|nr:Uma2 family endonuclease [Myxococcales bacterium]
MSDAAERQATYEDVLAAPSHVVAELIHGTLVTSPRPDAPHAYAASVLGMDLGGPFQRGRGGPGGWWILDEPELHFAGHVLVPDLAGWRREQMPEVPSVPYFELAPDWLCEVLSPSTEAWDRGEKLAIYAEAGVRWAWLVNPTLRLLEVLERVDESWVLRESHVGEVSVRVQPFEAVELHLGDLGLSR